MGFLEKLILGLFPKFIVSSTPWKSMWDQNERDEFVSSVKYILPLISLAYILHYYTVDRAEGLAPSRLWFNFRYGIASLSLITFIFYSLPSVYKKIKFYRLPAIINFSTICFFQSQAILWYPKIPYLYVFTFILLAVLVLRMDALKSFIFSGINLLICSPALIEAKTPTSMIFSAGLITTIFVVFLRLKYLSELKLFIETQKNIEHQKKIIEMNIEFTNQVKAFLPQEISHRLTQYIQKNRMNTAQAIDQVLRPKHADISCLYTDIRNFTKKSTDLNFLIDSMIPNVKQLTQIIEAHSGISRKVGDLIFAYYDDDKIFTNITNTLNTALKIQEANQRHNKSLGNTMEINRYIIVTSGKAIVGNLSGYNSSIEITALGQPINLLARIDELTKNSKLKSLLGDNHILIDPNTLSLMKKYELNLNIQQIDLEKSNLKIRDFEDIRYIYVIPSTEVNVNTLRYKTAKEAA